MVLAPFGARVPSARFFRAIVRVLSQAALLVFPLSFIPVVVPFMIIMHITGLLQLRHHRTPTAGPLSTPARTSHNP
jgi:hypothetical protein